MPMLRVLGWIWAIVGRVILYGLACLVITFLFVRQDWEQRGRSWQGRGRGGGGWHGDREPADRVIPAVNHDYDEALRQQKNHYPLQVCPVDGKPLDAFGKPLDYNHQGLLVRLCCEDCLVVFRGEPMHYSKSLLQESLLSNPIQGLPASGAD